MSIYVDYEMPKCCRECFGAFYGMGDIICWFTKDRIMDINKQLHNCPLQELTIDIIPTKQCNKCKYYYGVHDCPGHAPCMFWNIGGVMYNDYCSRFEEGERCEQ